MTSDRFLKHTERTSHWVPFVYYDRPTAMYFLDKIRYGKYFHRRLDLGGIMLHENDHKVKRNIQMLYQSEMEQQGTILRSIFVKREAAEDSKVVNYLMWLDWQWTIYQRALSDEEYQDEGFVRFVQSDLTHATELTENFKFT